MATPFTSVYDAFLANISDADLLGLEDTDLDDLRLMLMTVPQEQLLERLCVSIKEDFGSAFYISANLELDWSSPYFAEMHEVFTLRRSYAVYDKKTIAKD